MARPIPLFLIALMIIVVAAAQNPPYRYLHCGLLIDRRRTKPTEQVRGDLDFRQKWFGGPVDVRVNVTGFDKDDDITEHAIHIHEYGDFTDACGAPMGPHYNPANTYHGAPHHSLKKRHVGDLGNLKEDKHGNVVTSFTIDMPPILGEYGVVGRALQVMEGPDNFGKTGKEHSKRTGNAGKAISCCLLGEIIGDNGVWF